MARKWQIVFIAIFFPAMIAACAPVGEPADPRLSGPSATDLNRLLVAQASPRLIAKDALSATQASSIAARVLRTSASSRQRLKSLEISAIPFLRRSPAGIEFLARSGHRALARGEPAASCPAAAASPPTVASPEMAAKGALEACLAQLNRRRAPETCGCRLLAVENRLLAPASDFSFAPSVSAFLLDSANRKLRALVAESGDAVAGIETAFLRDPGGTVGQIRFYDTSAELTFARDPDRVWRGERQFFGYRRGRLAERLVLKDDAGAALTLLIGVERRDILPES